MVMDTMIITVHGIDPIIMADCGTDLIIMAHTGTDITMAFTMVIILTTIMLTAHLPGVTRVMDTGLQEPLTHHR